LPIDREAILKNADAYLDFLRKRFCADAIDEALETRAYTYVMDPPALQDLIVSFLRDMWQEHLAAEWERVRPMLNDAVAAFQQMDLGRMSKREAAEAVIGRKLKEAWEEILTSAERIVFIPSAHVGPYLWNLRVGGMLYIVFGARLPSGVQYSAPDLSRAEILVRLNALADDNRLRILQLVSDEGEQRSQDIISRLDLSQSTVSRHLKQLVATGYLGERRCNGAKCYQLETERIKDTLQAISTFLLG
jgi:DNA-binding transcriptional ArsR family regulator